MSSVREVRADMPHADVQARTVIRFEQVRKVYDRHGARTTALDGLSFVVREGEYLCIIGRTGCGKSTTLNLLLGLQQASGGRIEVLGCDPWKQFRTLKGQLGCVFQGDRLLPWRSILDNVRLPLEILGLDERKLAIGPLEWLQRVGLGDFAAAYPHELSGGMRQRAAMARALVSSPRIILADEAFGHLDEVTGRQLKADLRRLAREGGQTVVHITHSIDEAIEQADRILLFGRGRLFASFQGRAEASPDREGFRRHLYAQIELSGRAAVEQA